MTFDYVSRLAYWRFYMSRTWGFLLMWQKGERTEMKMDAETALCEIWKQDNKTEEEEQEEKRTSQINKPR